MELCLESNLTVLILSKQLSKQRPDPFVKHTCDLYIKNYDTNLSTFIFDMNGSSRITKLWENHKKKKQEMEID